MAQGGDFGFHTPGQQPGVGVSWFLPPGRAAYLVESVRCGRRLIDAELA